MNTKSLHPLQVVELDLEKMTNTDFNTTNPCLPSNPTLLQPPHRTTLNCHVLTMTCQLVLLRRSDKFFTIHRPPCCCVQAPASSKRFVSIRHYGASPAYGVGFGKI